MVLYSSLSAASAEAHRHDLLRAAEQLPHRHRLRRAAPRHAASGRAARSAAAEATQERSSGEESSVCHVTMTGVARLGVGIGLVGRRAEMAALGAALERAADGKPTGVLLAGDAGVGKSRLVAETVERAAAAGFAVLTGRCLDSAASLPYLPFTEVVGQLVASRPEQLAAHPELRGCCPAACRTASGPRGSRAGPAAGVRRHALGARFAHRGVPRAAGARGPALGRPVEPRSAGVPAVPAHRAAAGRAGHLPHRRPAPAPSAAAGALRAGAPARRRAAGPGPARRRATPSTSSASSPTAACPSRCSAGPPSAARATRSSPRSWSRPRPTGCRTGSPRC